MSLLLLFGQGGGDSTPTVTTTTTTVGVVGPRLDLSRDYLVWDGVERIVYAQATRTGETSVVLPVAKRRAVQTKEPYATGGVIASADLAWYLPQATMPPGLLPKMGDVVIDTDGERWTVYEVDRNKIRQTWKLTCRNLAVAHQLGDLVDIERPSLVTDAAGVPVFHWPSGPVEVRGGRVVVRNLPCRVQPTELLPNEERGIKSLEQRYEVTVDRQLQLDEHDRIRFGNDYLDVTRYRAAESIVDLPVIECVRRVQ